MGFDVAPLPHEWMIISIIGFCISWLYFYNEIGVAHPEIRKWGVAFMVFFFVVFVACIVSMSNASTSDEHLSQLAIHEKRR